MAFRSLGSNCSICAIGSATLYLGPRGFFHPPSSLLPAVLEERRLMRGSQWTRRVAQYRAEFIKRNIRSQQELWVPAAVAFPACRRVEVYRISRSRMRTQTRRRRRFLLLNASVSADAWLSETEVCGYENLGPSCVRSSSNRSAICWAPYLYAVADEPPRGLWGLRRVQFGL